MDLKAARSSFFGSYLEDTGRKIAEARQREAFILKEKLNLDTLLKKTGQELSRRSTRRASKIVGNWFFNLSPRYLNQLSINSPYFKNGSCTISGMRHKSKGQFVIIGRQLTRDFIMNINEISVSFPGNIFSRNFLIVN